MAKVKTFKTIFPAVSVPLNDDYSINEPEFRAYLRWIKTFYGKGMDGLVCNGHTGEITGLTKSREKTCRRDLCRRVWRRYDNHLRC